MSATVRGDDLRGVRALVALKDIGDERAEGLADELRQQIGSRDETELLSVIYRAETYVKAWEENLHPRDRVGRFSRGGGGGGAARSVARATSSSGSSLRGGTPQKVPVAASALQAGQDAVVSPQDLPDLARELAKDGPSALHKLAVEPPPEPNLFRKHAREIPRSEMPQIPTDAESMGRFKDFLASKGLTFKAEHISPTQLTATQNQLDGAKVGKFIERGFDESKMGAILTSRELDVADGHHRWAASAIHAIEKPGYEVPIMRIDADIDTLLSVMEEFDKQEGVAHTGFGATGTAARGSAKAVARGGFSKFDSEKPPGPPPDPNKPYMWLDGQWVLVASDTADGIPENLDYLDKLGKSKNS